MEQLSEEKRREILNRTVNDNLPPIETINFIASKGVEQKAKEMSEVSIDNALFTLNEKKKIGFNLLNYDEFSKKYEEHFEKANPEIKKHVQEYLERKMVSGEMQPLFKKIEYKNKETPETITAGIFFRVFNDEMNKKLRKAIETGGNEMLYKEIKDKIIQEFRENASILASHDYNIKLSEINNKIQNNARVPGWMSSKLNLDDRQNEIAILNTIIKNKSIQLKKQQTSEIKQQEPQKQTSEEPEEEEEKFTLEKLNLPIEDLLEIKNVQKIEKQEIQQQAHEEPKTEETNPPQEPSIKLFLETFFKKETVKGKTSYTRVKKDLANGGGKKVEGKILYEKAREFIKIYSEYHNIKKYEKNPNLLKKDEKAKEFFVSEHIKLVNLIKKLKSVNPQNTKNPEDLEAYFNISSALNILHSRLSEFTTPYMEGIVSVT